MPALFLHSCCAPCSSYVLEYLSQYFNITLFFYNPNISPESEYLHRKAELKRLVQELPLGHPVRIVDGDYVPERFYALAKGLEDLPERGLRCQKCIGHRLEETFRIALQQPERPDYVCTTLTISPTRTPFSSIQRERNLRSSTALHGCPRILRKKVAISARSYCPENMTSIGRTSAAVCTAVWRRNGGKRRWLLHERLFFLGER